MDCDEESGDEIILKLVKGEDNDSTIESVCDNNQFDNKCYENNIHLNGNEFKQYSFADNDATVDISRKEMRFNITKC